MIIENFKHLGHLKMPVLCLFVKIDNCLILGVFFFLYCAPSDYRSPNIEKDILKIYVKCEFTSFVLLFSPFWEAAKGHGIS